MVEKLSKMFAIIEMPGAMRAMVLWSKFSFASYKILHRFVADGFRPKTIVDVGANKGQFSYACCRFFPGVALHSIEPTDDTFNRLRDNLKQFENVKLHKTAIGDYTGYISFKINADSQVNSALELGEDRRHYFPTSEVIETRTVPITTLDQLFQDEALAKPILLKIDVQGFEDRVIRGAKSFLQNVEWVIMEVSFSRLYEGEAGFNEVLSMMRQQGYEFYRPLNFHTAGSAKTIIEMDALFRRTDQIQ